MAGGAPPNPALYMQNAQAPMLAQMQQQVRQYEEMNRTLTTQLAQAQQQSQISKDRADLLAKQLQDSNAQVQQLMLAQRQTATQNQEMMASMNRRGGAKLTANNSVPPPAGPNDFQIPGTTVLREGNLIRIRISADLLFGQASNQLLPYGSSILDQVSLLIGRQFSRQRIGVEGHTDSGQASGGAYANVSQLAGDQAQAVKEHMVRRNNLPNQQLFTVAHGPNHPIGDNQTAAGRADNRRIEIVVYPETF